MHSGILFALLLLAEALFGAQLRNTMPNAALERFKTDANRKAARFPATYILEGEQEGRTLYLTFDDGPDRFNTPKILDILAVEGVKATFFFLGSRLDGAPEIVRRASADGHTILPHGFHHVDFRKHSFEHILIHQLIPASKAIAVLTGKEVPKAFRPPYGAVSDGQIVRLGDGGYRIINWSVDSFDWMKGRSSGEIVAEVMRYVHPGAIILLHSGGGNRQTPAALKELIPRLKREGYRFAPLY